MKRICLLLVIGGIFIPHIIFAQSINADLSIDTIPLDPRGGETVTLTAKSYGIDLNQTNIVWKYNNTVIAQGIGKTTIAVVAPLDGATGVITITTTSGATGSASASIILHPANIDMLWEAADAYTPPFYKGKALLPANGLIRYSIIPSASAPKGLTYSWSRNGSALPDESGYGKSTLLIKHNEFNPKENVEVAVSAGSFSGSSVTRLTPLTTPTVITYQSKEGFIDYAHGYTDSIPFTQSGMVLHFEPYYFSVPRTVTSDLSFDLSIDGEKVSASKPNEIGLSRPSTAGQSVLTLAITPIIYSLQHLEQKITLLFN